MIALFLEKRYIIHANHVKNRLPWKSDLIWPESCAVNTFTVLTFYPVVLFLRKQELTLSHGYCDVKRYVCWAFSSKNKQRYGMKLDCHLNAWLHAVPHDKTCLKNSQNQSHLYKNIPSPTFLCHFVSCFNHVLMPMSFNANQCMRTAIIPWKTRDIK